MDPLSDVLALLKPRSDMSGGFTAGGEWSIHYPAQAGIRFQAVISGECWLAVDGLEPVQLRAGNCTMLPHGRPFRLTSDLALPSVEARMMLANTQEGMARCNGGGPFMVVGSVFALTGKPADILLGILPPLVLVSGEPDQSDIGWYLARLMEELRERRPGFLVVVQNLSYTMLVHFLRLQLSAGSNGSVGWLFALADKRMSAAINAMHGDPSHNWTLQEMAERVGMSRSTFALTFKRTVGSSPLDYLTRWRMLLAGDRLTQSEETVSAISLSVGYESESAFGKAFKKTFGCSPRQYARSQNLMPASVRSS